MTKKSGLAQSLFIGGFDLTGDVGSVNDANITIGQLPQTGLNKSAIERTRAKRDGGISFASFFNDAAAQNHPVLTGLMGNRDQKIVIWALSQTRGEPALCFTSRVVSPYQRDHAADGAFTGTTTAVIDQDGVCEPTVLLTAPKDTHASASTSASVDGGASSANGASGYVSVLSIGSGTPTFILQDSANDSTFATLISFGAQAVNTSERATVAGTVDRYTRPQTTGTFTDAVFVMTIRRGTANDYAA